MKTPWGPIFETGALVLWLADTHALSTAPDGTGRPEFLHWLFFVTNTAHSDFRQLFYPDQHLPPRAQVGHAAIIARRILRNFGLPDDAARCLADLFAPYSVPAACVQALARWAVLYPKDRTGWLDFGSFPTLRALAHTEQARAATTGGADAEGFGASVHRPP